MKMNTKKLLPLYYWPGSLINKLNNIQVHFDWKLGKHRSYIFCVITTAKKKIKVITDIS